ncbi:MAG: response regulator transcription factor [Tissierellales bacterium]|nr:response regulator transcription factor [Tissierellales bacterium]
MKQIEVLSLNTEGIKSIEKLTKREYEIFSLLSKGLSNYEIANTLCISEKTVRNNLTSIYRKLNLKGRSEAILFFQKNQL